MPHNANDEKPSAWLLPQLLSVDAPLVALAWQSLLAQESGLPLKFAGRAALALTVWLIYIADRLLDVCRTIPPTTRHRFYHRHWRLAALALTVIAVADLLLIARNLRPAVLHSGLLLSPAIVGYLAIVHSPTVRRQIPKELLVALLFTAGTFVVAWTGAPHPIPVLLAPAAAFFVLCLANLILIDRWERVETHATPHPLTAVLARTFPLWLFLLTIVSLVNAGHLWYRAIALSAAATLMLFFGGMQLRPDTRRILADLVLLTPVCFLFR